MWWNVLNKEWLDVEQWNLCVLLICNPSVRFPDCCGSQFRAHSYSSWSLNSLQNFLHLTNIEYPIQSSNFYVSLRYSFFSETKSLLHIVTHTYQCLSVRTCSKSLTCITISETETLKKPSRLLSFGKSALLADYSKTVPSTRYFPSIQPWIRLKH